MVELLLTHGTRYNRVKQRAVGISLIASAALTLSILASPASANFGSEGPCGYLSGSSAQEPQFNCVRLGNNKWHAVRPHILGNQWEGIDDGLAWSVANNYDPTDLIAYITTTDDLPDVWAYDWYYGNSLVAWVNCPADNTGTGSHGSSLLWCRGQDLIFNADLAYERLYVNIPRAISCHELGHTVGLRHGNETTSCMHQTQDPPYTKLTDHDRSHLNGFY